MPKLCPFLLENISSKLSIKFWVQIIKHLRLNIRKETEEAFQGFKAFSLYSSHRNSCVVHALPYKKYAFGILFNFSPSQHVAHVLNKQRSINIIFNLILKLIKKDCLCLPHNSGPGLIISTPSQAGWLHLA